MGSVIMLICCGDCNLIESQMQCGFRQLKAFLIPAVVEHSPYVRKTSAANDMQKRASCEKKKIIISSNPAI
jgi:hypothetical protein